MITATPAMHLLVALAMATPTADPSACAAEDLRCSGLAYAAAARRATSDVERVEYLYFASRAHLGLAKRASEGASTRSLCKAKQLIDQAFALPATKLRERVVESRRATLSRLAEAQVQCGRPRQGRKEEAPLVTRDEHPGELLAPPVAESSATPVAVSAGTAETTEPLARETVRPTLTPGEARVPSTRADATQGEPRVQHEPPAGRRLLIGGGVSLAAGLVLTGAAAWTGTLALDARRTGYASMGLEATPENLLRNTRLEDEYRRFAPVAVVTGVAAGAAVVAAVVMLTVGARRKARAASGEPVLMPVRTGLLFTVRF